MNLPKAKSHVAFFCNYLECVTSVTLPSPLRARLSLPQQLSGQHVKTHLALPGICVCKCYILILLRCVLYTNAVPVKLFHQQIQVTYKSKRLVKEIAIFFHVRHFPLYKAI